MKYLISGGGTGGHIYPALAIAEGLKEKDENAEIVYVGTENGLEADLVPRAGFKFETIRVKPLPRKINKKFFTSIKELMLGINDSRKIINKYKPDIMIGTGGYVCGPILLMGSFKKIPTMIHEQNAYPGITNKILARFVDRVAITFDEASLYFKNKKNIVKTGNPVRESILSLNKDKVLEELGYNKEAFIVLSFGGSSGQKILNDTMLEVIKKIPENIDLIHVTGKDNYSNFEKKIKEDGIEIKSNIKILDYLYDMDKYLNIASLIISPSGAMTLSEISALGLPSILIPKSYTAENHQIYNANYFKENGASEVILEKDLSPDKLLYEINNLKDNKNLLSEMSINSKKLGEVNALDKIVSEVKKVMKI